MYCVAFRYTAKAGAYKGACTWTSFESKEAFDVWYTDEIKEREEILAEGISDKECIQLTTKETPLSTWLRVALHESLDPETGESDEKVLKMQILKLKMLGVL